MNRREFNIRLAALGAAPLAPTIPAAAAKTATLSGKAAAHYPWAVQYARVHNACSPQRLGRVFRLSPDTAREIFTKMQADGLVSAPGLAGIARSADPINWDFRFPAKSVQSAGQSITRRLRKVLSDDVEAPPQTSDEPLLKEATETESARSTEDRPSDSAESPPA